MGGMYSISKRKGKGPSREELLFKKSFPRVTGGIPPWGKAPQRAQGGKRCLASRGNRLLEGDTYVVP